MIGSVKESFLHVVLRIFGASLETVLVEMFDHASVSSAELDASGGYGGAYGFAVDLADGRACRDGCAGAGKVTANLFAVFMQCLDGPESWYLPAHYPEHLPL